MFYVKLDLTHNRAGRDIDNLRPRFLEAFPNNRLSVNVNAAGTLAWVKLDRDYGISSPAILDTELGSNTKALADVYAGGWYPEE